MTDNKIYSDAKIDVVKRGEYLELKYKMPHLIRIKVGDRQAIDDEVIRMLKMRAPGGSKYFMQREVGKIIGVSRQMINRRWQVYSKEGLVSLLSGEWEKSKITPQLLNRLARSLLKTLSCSCMRSKSVCRKKGYVKKYQMPLYTVP